MSEPLGGKYPGNSNAKKQRPELQKVISGEVIQRKKPLGRKIAEHFTGADARSIGEYVLFDILLPAFKDMIFESFTGGLERSLFGESRRRRTIGRGGGGSSSYVSYSGFNERSRNREIDRRDRAKHDFREIILKTRAEAEEVLDQMRSLVDTYESASVNDLYDLVDITGEYVDQRWGWNKRNFYDATIRRISDGYLLDFPKPIPLD